MATLIANIALPFRTPVDIAKSAIATGGEGVAGGTKRSGGMHGEGLVVYCLARGKNIVRAYKREAAPAGTMDEINFSSAHSYQRKTIHKKSARF